MNFGALNNSLSPIANVITIAVAIVAAFRAIRRPWVEADPDKRHRWIGYGLVIAGLFVFAAGFLARYLYDAPGTASIFWLAYIVLFALEFGRRKRPLGRLEVIALVLAIGLTMNLLAEARVASVARVSAPTMQVDNTPSSASATPQPRLPKSFDSATPLGMTYGEYIRKTYSYKAREDQDQFRKNHQGQLVDWIVTFKQSSAEAGEVRIQFGVSQQDPWKLRLLDYPFVASGFCDRNSETTAINLTAGETLRIQAILDLFTLSDIVIISHAPPTEAERKE